MILPQDHGAHANGIDDDTLAIQTALEQSAVTGERVRLPAGAYKVTDTLQYHGPGTLEGDGKLAARLYWHGPKDKAALNVDRAWNYSFRDFSIINAGQPQTGIGISTTAMDRPAGGTRSGGANWSMVSVDGFEFGVQLGTPEGQATSEIHFDHLTAVRCWTGVRANSFNTLNLNFTMLEISDNRCGLEAVEGSNIHVNGGTATGNRIYDFRLCPGGLNTLTNFRSEIAACFVYCSNTVGATVLHIAGCMAHAANPKSWLVVLRGGVIATLTGNYWMGQVGVHGPARLLMLGNAVQDSRPVHFFDAGEEWPGSDRGSYRLLGNVQISQDNVGVKDFADESRVIG